MKESTSPDTRRFRLTRQRQLILAALRQLHTHPTADELHQIVRRELPHISLGTVYRNLDVLCEQGLALRLEMGGAQRRYDGTASAHHHAQCLRCGRLVDVPEHLAPKLEVRLDQALGFEVTECRLELYGVCRACARRGEERPSAGEPQG
jgi:Fur family ferric uptake transcriptional regulator